MIPECDNCYVIFVRDFFWRCKPMNRSAGGWNDDSDAANSRSEFGGDLDGPFVVEPFDVSN